MPWYWIQDLLVTVAVSLVVLIPVTGLTLRFAVRPFLKDLAETRGEKRLPAASDTDRRLDRMEQQLEQLDSSINRLLEVTEFDRQLKAGKPPDEDS